MRDRDGAGRRADHPTPTTRPDPTPRGRAQAETRQAVQRRGAPQWEEAREVRIKLWPEMSDRDKEQLALRRLRRIAARIGWDAVLARIGATNRPATDGAGAARRAAEDGDDDAAPPPAWRRGRR